ncbi:MAG TPA: glycosyltransferase family 2 protein [Acidimicrobiia bacterium]|nr:glycosyltransferase family 2 protein [Acidimicrobiia bacterium]
MGPRWAAVIVNYNAGPMLEACVRSLLADTSAGGPPEVVVVDNASTDGSAEPVEAGFPEVTVVRASANVGFARGNNRGVATTRAPIVAAINPDVEVEPGTARALLARFDAEDDLGAVGPRVHNPDGTQYPSARTVPSATDALGHATFGRLWPTNPFTRRYHRMDEDHSTRHDVDWLSGSALWLRRTAFDDIGGWDEQFFLYLEDVDLCTRLREHSWRVAYDPTASVLHVQGVSAAGHPFRTIVEHHRSAFRYATKHWRGVRRLLLGPAVVLLAVRGLADVIATGLGRAQRTRAPHSLS